MQRPGRTNQAASWRALLRFDKARITPDVAIRNTIGVVLPLLAGVLLGNISAGAVGSLAALNVSYSDNRDPYSARAQRMLRATLLVSLAVVTGALAGRNHAAAVVAVSLWAFGAGLMVVLGPQAGNLGVTTLVTLVVFAARPLGSLQALQSGMIAIGAGLVQTLLAVAFWPVNRYEPERRIIGSLYQALADLCVSPAGPGGAPPATPQLAETQKVLTSLAPDRTRQAERYTFLVNQAERVRLVILTLRRLMHRLQRNPEGTEAGAAIERLLAASSGTLAEAARAVVDRTGIALDAVEQAANEFRKIAQHKRSPLLSAAIRDASHQIDALGGQLRAVRNLLTASTSRRPRAKPAVTAAPPAPNSILSVLRANFTFRSTAFRHALRLAICVGGGEAFGHLLNLQRTYWLTMTIAIVLRPDYTSTFIRGILRITGTLAGLLFATGLFRVLHSGQDSEIVFLAVFVFLLRWIGPANYGIFVTAISAYIVVFFALTGTSPADVTSARAVNTILGGIIALVAYLIWPTWERTQAGPVLANLMDSYANYFHCVADAYIAEHSHEPERNRARTEARLARSNAEDLIDRIAGEPGTPIERANLLHGILSSAHNFVRAVMALESVLYQSQRQRVRPATAAFANQVNLTLQALSRSLRSSMPVPRLPDLREAHNAILATEHADSDQYTLVNTETDRITTSVDTLALQISRWLRP